jgi:hypothetical protein
VRLLGVLFLLASARAMWRQGGPGVQRLHTVSSCCCCVLWVAQGYSLTGRGGVHGKELASVHVRASCVYAGVLKLGDVGRR